MGLFFTIVTLGLASHLPKHLYSGLVAAGVSPAAAHTVANEPPIGSLFSAFLGYNPIKELLGPTGALQHLPPGQAAYITGRSFFPKLIEQPFADGLHLAFTFGAIATGIAVIASALRGRRYMHQMEPLAEELAEGAAEDGGLYGLEPFATDGRDAPETIGTGATRGHPAGDGRNPANGQAAPANGRGTNARRANGRRANGRGANGRGANGRGANERRSNGQATNGSSAAPVGGAADEPGAPLGGAADEPGAPLGGAADEPGAPLGGA